MAKRKNDDGRGPVYMAADGTYHASAKLRDAYENRGALAEWLETAAERSVVDLDPEGITAIVISQVNAIQDDGAAFLALLRKAGVRAKRGSKATGAEKQAA